MTNLVALCLECHGDIHAAGGGLRRRLTSAQVRRMRDEWYESVRERKRAGLPRAYVDHSEAFTEIIDAVAIVRVREIRATVARDGRVSGLWAFVEGFGPRVAMEVLAALVAAVGSADQDRDRADEMSSLIQALMPFGSLVGPRFAPVTPDERTVMTEAVEVGRDLSALAARRTHDLTIFNAGGRAVWAVLRFATVNKDVALRRSAMAAFEVLMRWCVESGFADGQRWAQFLIDDATQWPEFTGVFPYDLADKIGKV